MKCIVVPTMSDRNVIFCLQLLRCVRFISMHIFSASGNRESRSGSCLSTIDELGSIQISDTRISDRFSDVIVTK